MPDESDKPKTGGITKTGGKETLRFNAEEAEALRRAALCAQDERVGDHPNGGEGGLTAKLTEAMFKSK